MDTGGSLRREMRSMGGLTDAAPPTNQFVMPTFEDGSTYGPGDPVYEAVSSHFDPESWNTLDDDAKWSVIESLEASLPVEPAPVRPKAVGTDAGPALKGMDSAHKARLPFGPSDIKGLFGSERRRGK